MKINAIKEAKCALDKIIKKSRMHLYKPIQVGEILYHYRMFGDLNLDDVESYRVASRSWRDELSLALLGRKCSSSIGFQDNLFGENAVPPRLVKLLALENKRTNGAVEAYIYSRFINKHAQLKTALDVLNKCA